MTSRKTRIVMLASAALIGVVLLLFAIASLNARADRREAAYQRFQDKAVVSASLIQNIFSSSLRQAAEQNTEDFGTPRIDPKKIARRVKENALAYIVVLDDKGRILATSDGLDSGVTAAIEESPSHVDAVLSGQPWFMSGIVRGDTAEYVSSFDGETGRRLLVQGFPVKLLAGFIGGTLSQLPNGDKETAFVVDSQGQVVASAENTIAPASKAPEVGEGQEETDAAVGNTTWSVVLAADESDLYKGVFNPVQWLILIALAIAGAITLFLLHRAMRTTGQLEAAYAELERSNAELARTNVELQRSNGELEQFASVASHDLQEPLRKVQTFGDQLERRHGADLDDEAKDYLRRMRNASARMSVLIDDLLRFSRVTTHAKPHVPVDLGRVARDVLSDLETRVAETGGRVEIGELPTVQADPTQMRQLLQNLIGNALKFHRPDVPPVVTLATVRSPRAGTVAFTVADNGIGFEDHYQDRIFRVFERLHPRDVYAGTGIGLALCRKIAERHGGSIEGEGVPGQGATFTVVLPAGKGAATPPATAAAPEPAHA